MKRILVMLLLLAPGAITFGQAKKTTCNCPTTQDLAHQGAPDKTFYFKNGQQIGLCGDADVQNKDTIYSEVILYHCGAGGFFRAWDGTQTCKITQHDDSIVVQKLVRLPIGKNMELVSTTFKIATYFYRGPRFMEGATYRSDLPLYNSAQIQKVLDQYSKLAPKDYDNILLVARRLFWAYASGSDAADKCLEKMDEQFGPFIGPIADEVDEIHSLYWFWKLDHLALKSRGTMEKVID